MSNRTKKMPSQLQHQHSVVQAGVHGGSGVGGSSSNSSSGRSRFDHDGKKYYNDDNLFTVTNNCGSLMHRKK